MDINNEAPVITRDEILISAPIQTIWEIQTDVPAWPSRQPDVDSAEADAPRRIVWGGPAQGIVAVHIWTFDEQADGVLVRTAESWEGDPVAAQPETMQAALDGSLRTWLEILKRAAERTVG